MTATNKAFPDFPLSSESPFETHRPLTRRDLSRERNSDGMQKYNETHFQSEAFNAITNPNKTFVSVSGVHHMSLYTNRDHLAKVGKVQATWLKNLLDSIE